MEYSEIMVRYGELSTKGKNKKDFINRLNGNVQRALNDFPELSIHPKRDRLHIELNGTDPKPITDILREIFGIQNFSLSVQVDKNDINQVKQVALELIKPVNDNHQSFKINTKRSDHDYMYDTNDMNQLLGDFLTTELPDLKVQMRNPDVTLRVEVRQDAIYLSSETIIGAGGMPVGTAGNAVMMLSGGIDSPVASYLAMKRGINLTMVHFFSPPYTSEQALNKAKELTARLAKYSGSINFIEVPFAKIQEEIKEKVPEGYLMTIQRRMMMRLADIIREQQDGLAIVNGESVGQVASQTLESMVAINDVTTTPILRPVATLDKNEIIKIAKDINTFDLSILPFEDCCTIFAPPKPKTKPRLDKSRKYEQLIDIEGLINDSLANLKITRISPNQEFVLNEDISLMKSLL